VLISLQVVLYKCMNGMCLCFFQIMNEITQQKINIYEFPNCADEEENKMMRKLKVR